MARRERIERVVVVQRGEWWPWDELALALGSGDSAPEPWKNFLVHARRLLEVDVSGLCQWFDGNVTYTLPLRMGHTFVEPALAHVRNHDCGRGPAQTRHCAAARSILTLALGVQAEGRRWQEPVGKGLLKAAKGMRKVAVELGSAIDAGARAAGVAGVPGEGGGPAGEALRTVARFKGELEHSANVYANYVSYSITSREPVRQKPSDRPTVVSAEGELLEDGHFSEEEVLGFCKDVKEGSTSAPLKLLRKRGKGPAEALQLDFLS